MDSLSIAEKTKLKRQAALAKKGVLPAKKARTEGASTVADAVLPVKQKSLPPAEAVSSTPADREIEMIGTKIVDTDDLEIRESPLKRRGKKKVSPTKKGVGQAELWVPDFGKDAVYVVDSVSNPEVAIKVSRHMMLPADEEFYQKQSLGALRKAFAASALTTNTIGAALDAVYSVEVGDLKKQLKDAQAASKAVPGLQADLETKKEKIDSLEAEKLQADKDLAALRSELESAKKKATNADAKALSDRQLLETERLQFAHQVKKYQTALKSNEATLSYWRPKICQYGYDLCLKQVIEGVAPADLPKVAEVPPGWWGDDRDCLSDQEFEDFPPEDEPTGADPTAPAADA